MNKIIRINHPPAPLPVPFDSVPVPLRFDPTKRKPIRFTSEKLVGSLSPGPNQIAEETE